jgi:hypothetical protein
MGQPGRSFGSLSETPLMFRYAPRSRLLAAAVPLVVAAACSQAPDQRVRASGEVSRRLLAGGGKLVQDYGAFQVIGAGAAPLGELAGGDVVPVDGRILLNAGAFDPGEPVHQAARTAAAPVKGRTLGLVQFVGPVRPEWREALVTTGARIVAYVPNDAYLVYGDAAALEGLRGLARTAGFVRWAGAYLDTDKLAPQAASPESGAWTIQLVEDAEANAETLAAVALVEQEATQRSAALGYVNLVVRCAAGDLAAIAARPDVVSIQPHVVPTMHDERQAMLVSGHVTGTGPSGPGYLAWLASVGFTQAQFTASGFGVDVSDSGLDNGTTTPNHLGLYVGGDATGTSRVAYARLLGTPHAGSTIQGCDGHGTINAHIIGGHVASSAAPHVDAAGYHYGVGIAPFVRIGSSVVFDPSSFTYPRYEDLASLAWADGMRISSNSWGASTNAYTSDSQRYDALVRDAAPGVAGNQEMVFVFSAGNGGPGASTVGSPGTAKNVITVGGTENVQPFGGADGCGVGDQEADSVLDIATFSSRGPTSDGRRKPDVVAPATHVSGGVAQADGQRAAPPAAPAGQALACYGGSGVCGGVASSYFFPASQQWYTASTGTSHSAPAVAGAAALVRQWFLNHGRPAPSAAMTKAYLMSTGRYLTGAGAADALPSNAQGMGLVDLGAAFDGDKRLLVDQDPAYLLTATGQTRTFTGAISDPSLPLRVTLAWTDAPGSTTGAAWANDLDLTVTVGPDTYRGNVFTGGTSVTGGAADPRNNVESVFLPAGTRGPFTITVTAANIVADGVPGNGMMLDQDFALAIQGACWTAPEAPTGVTATATAANQVEVSWAPSGASKYRVYRSAGGPHTLVGEVAAPPYLDTTVSGLLTYTYVVRATECAESPDSNAATVTTTGACTVAPIFAGAASATSDGTATCGIRLSWPAATALCGGAVTYDVFRSTLAGFTPGPANRIAAGVAGTSFRDDGGLANGATYRYVVRATETSNAVNTDQNSVERAATVFGPEAVSFQDDFDLNRPANAQSYWSASGSVAALSLTSGCRYQSSGTSYRFGAASTGCGGSYANNLDATLVLGGDGTGGVNGLVPGVGATLTFNQWYALESGWDSAWLAYSTSSASGPWTYVPDAPAAGQPSITAGGYDRVNSYVGTRVWSAHLAGAHQGANGALRQVSVDLSALAGQRVWFAWRFKTDSIIAYEGFYLDDVRVSAVAACTTGAPPPGPGPATTFLLSGPATAIAGNAAAVTVMALNASGQTAAGYAGTAVVASSDGRAVLPGPLTFSGGIATATVELRTAGRQTLTVTDQADPVLAGSGAVAVLAGPPAALAFDAQPPAATAGVVLAPAVRVRVVDAYGNPTAATDAVTVALGANPGGATLLGTLTVPASRGLATFSDLVLQRAAAGYTLTASAASRTGATSASFTVSPAAAASLDFVQQASTVAAGDPIGPAPAVALRDAYGNVTHSTAVVSLALSGGPSGAALSGTATASAVDGVAKFPGLSVNLAGQGYQLVASSAGCPARAGASFGVTPASADHLVFARPPPDVVAGVAFSPALSVAAQDRFGNLATGFVGDVSLGFARNPSSASLAGTTTATATGGVAVFPGVSIARAGSGYILSASSGTVTAATSGPFSVSAGPVAQLVFGTGPGPSVAGAPLAGPPTVFLADAHGNRTAVTDPVTLSLGANPGRDILSGALTVYAVAGAAVFTDVILRRAADGYTLVATSGSATPARSGAFAVSGGPPAALQFTATPGRVTEGAAITPAPEVHVLDAYGNGASADPATVTTVTLALGANPAPGTLSGTTSASAVGGVARFPGLSIDHAGEGYTLAATSPGLDAAATGVFYVAPAPPAPPSKSKSSGCGCGTADPGELGLLLALGALWRAVVAARRSAGTSSAR